jgi:two-component system phosphate regulon sensor histidine kinase PhoR
MTVVLVLLLAVPPLCIIGYFLWSEAYAFHRGYAVLALAKNVSWLLLLAFAAAAFAIYRFVAASIRPLEEVAGRAERLAGGALEVRIRSDRADEIGTIASALNRLVDRIEDAAQLASEERSRLSAVLANLLSGVLLIDAEGDVILTNRAARRLLATTANPVGRNHRFIHRNYHLATAVEDVLETGERVDREVTVHGPEETIIRASVLPIAVGPSSATGVLAVLHDVTEARRLQKLKANLIADVSHELKTPVTAIRGFAETLSEGALQKEESAERFVSIIEKEASRLERLIEDLLQLSLIESRGVELEEERVKIAALIESLAERYRPRAETHGIELDVDIFCEDCRVLGDPHYLDQAISNLIDNALKYTERGGMVSIAVRDLPDGRVEVAVEDNGVGIPEADLPYVFDRFYRVERARSRKAGGTGLGLAIVKHIVSAHNGEVDVESTVSEGSRFWMRLPVYQEDLADSQL